jgi:hypothetical protein
VRSDRIGVRRVYVVLLLLALAVAGVVTFQVLPDAALQARQLSPARAWIFVMAALGCGTYATLNRYILRRGADSDEAFVLLWPSRIMLLWGTGHGALWVWPFV